MDIKRALALELTRDHIKELNDSIPIGHQLVVEAIRDTGMTKSLVKTEFFFIK
jgi:hypothetical protein